MKRAEILFVLAKIPVDYAALLAAAITAYYARFLPVFTSVRPVIFTLTASEYMQIVMPIAFVWLAVFAFSGLYTTARRGIAADLLRVILACSTSMASVFAILFFSRALFESRFIAIAAWLFAIAFVSLGRVALHFIQRSLLVFGVGEHRLVIIGSDNTTEALADLFARDHRLGFHVTGRFETFDEKTASQILALKKSHGVDEIILGDATVDRDTALDILTFTDVNHLGFKYASDLFAAAAGRSVVHMFAGIPVIEVKKTPLDGWGAIFKRGFDIFGAILLILLTSPIQLLIALAVYLEQPGSVLYSKTQDGKKALRVGQGGEPFHYFKFRSMVKDAHAKQLDPTFVAKHGNERDGSPLFKLRDDPRVTPVGRIIRKYHLDELPELFLVLAGHMSLVGPRPHLPEEVAQYKPHHRKVMTIKPGITGLAQISGNSELDFEEEVRLDTFYIEHWSPWLDLVTLLKTPWVAFRGKTN